MIITHNKITIIYDSTAKYHIHFQNKSKYITLVLVLQVGPFFRSPFLRTSRPLLESWSLRGEAPGGCNKSIRIAPFAYKKNMEPLMEYNKSTMQKIRFGNLFEYDCVCVGQVFWSSIVVQRQYANHHCVLDMPWIWVCVPNSEELLLCEGAVGEKKQTPPQRSTRLL